ncbi:hypothetical protein GGR54DRAFT_278303 [Hypoxylon sp. NC1633]|nr:hypothetical protein GGR54DRAFT_278303 [Hypoxylon sp. NC1633]
MDDTTERELRERAQGVLEHLIRPREEVIAVRRHLAHDLAKSLGADHLSSPLSLVDLDTVVTPSEGLQGIYREYIDAVQRNIEIRAEFSKLQQEHDAAAAAASVSSPSEEDDQTKLLELQLEVNALEQKHKRLGIVHKYLEELNQQPAAAPDFLDPDVMFKNCASLPELPKELMDSFTEDRDAPQRDIQELLSRLQKAVLRNKLLAQQEKQKLEILKAKNPIDPSTLPPEAQLHNLNAVKDSLITWIETMLSKAGDDEDEPSSESPVKTRQGGEEKFDREARLAEIQTEYDRHLKLRMEILTSIAQLKQLKLEPSRKQEQESEPPKPTPRNADSEAFLLTPYLEKLQAISREQKGLIQEKSHINAYLAKQQQDLNKTLNHLVEESHLLPKYGPSKSDRSKASFSEATKGVSKSNVVSQIEPWISAANSAQIATLEAVFEKVEEGQVAAEDAMQALDQVRKLLNKDEEPVESQKDQDNAEPDMWVGEDDENGETRVRKHSEKKVEKQKGESIYAKLDGNLGLINE